MASNVAVFLVSPDSFLFDDTEQDAIVAALFGWHVVLLGRQSLFRHSLVKLLTLQHHDDVPTAIANHLAPNEVAWLDRLRLPPATRKVWQYAGACTSE